MHFGDIIKSQNMSSSGSHGKIFQGRFWISGDTEAVQVHDTQIDLAVYPILLLYETEIFERPIIIDSNPTTFEEHNAQTRKTQGIAQQSSFAEIFVSNKWILSN